jgi:hypothetical protein
MGGPSMGGHTMGGHVGMAPHFSSGRGFGHGFGRFDHRHNFAFRNHDFDRFRHHDFDRDDRFRDFDRDDRFFRRHHRHIFCDFDFVAFGFPWWYPYPYSYGYPYDYSYSDYGPAYDYQYWNNLAVSVQSELARLGYYHGRIDGVIGLDSGQAIQAFQAAQGLPVTGVIDPKLLNALGISYRSA